MTSDLHLGAGADDIHEDFYQDDAFAAWVGGFDATATVVLNGDVIDFAQIEPLSVAGLPSRLLWDEEASMEKFERAVAGHPQVFDALAAHLDRGGQLDVTIGNHDLDLIWDRVQTRFRQRLGDPPAGRFRFEVGAVDYHGVRIQHGHQFTPENCPRDPESFRHLYDDGKGERLFLERVWGTDFVLSFFNPLEAEYPFADNVKPASRLLAAGIRNHWIRAEHLVALASFLKRRKVPLALLTKVLADDPDLETLRAQVSLAHVAAAFADPQWKGLVLEAAANTNTRADMEQALAGLDADQLAALKQPDQVDVDAENPEGDITPAVLGVFRKSPEMRAARDQIRNGARHVVYGHTHRVVDGANINDSGAKLFNPGTWIPRLRIDTLDVTQDTLKDHTLYTWTLNAVNIPASHPDAITMTTIPTIATRPDPNGRPQT